MPTSSFFNPNIDIPLHCYRWKHNLFKTTRKWKRNIRKDLLDIRIFDTRKEMGKAAADDVAAEIKTLLSEKLEVNMIFAAAPFRNEFLEALVGHKDCLESYQRISHGWIWSEWTAVKQSFVHFLHEAIFDKLPFKVYCPEREEQAWGWMCALLQTAEGIPRGYRLHGHRRKMAMPVINDPPVADFKDPKLVKIVVLILFAVSSRFTTACFATLDDVFTHAFTLTVPALMSAKYLNCIVPCCYEGNKLSNVPVNGPIRESCPASILREQPHAVLYLDKDSSSKLS